MPKKARYQNRIELLQGTLDMLILRTLQWGPQHGYGIGQVIHSNSHDVLNVESGSLYPALHRLEKEGWIASEWGLSENKQRAKFYRLTVVGRRHLLNKESRWEEFVKAVGAVMNPAKVES